MSEGLRIYNLFPTLAGTVRQWAIHLPRIAALGFNSVYINPFHFPGFSGSLYAVKDYYRLNPRFRGTEPDGDDALLRGFTDAAREYGLRGIMDLVVNHTSKDSELLTTRPDWFTRDARGNLVSPQATDPADPRQKTIWGDLAELDYRSPQRRQILAYFQQLVRHYIGLGFDGFRCDAAYKVPAEVWRGLIDDAKAASPDVLFCAENLGAPKEAVLALTGAGFDYRFNSFYQNEMHPFVDAMVGALRESGARTRRPDVASKLLLRILDGGLKPVIGRVVVPCLVRGDELITETGVYGGVIRQAQLFPMIRAELDGILAGYIEKLPDIVPPELAERAGVLGALALAVDSTA